MTLHLSPEEIVARNRAKQKQWRLDHPERVKEFHRRYNAKSEVSARKTQWAREHRDEINKRRREIYQSRRQESAAAELRCRAPSEVTQAVA